MIKLENNPRPGCAFCQNLATASCDVYDKKRKAICGLMLCHQHRHRTFGVDCCAKHYPSERAKQSEIAVTKQQSLFESV
jgi:hypothetical protein